MNGNKIRVLVVDDNELFRQGLISLLSRLETMTVVGQARDGYEAVSKTSLLRPDVILMDLSMPRMDGVSATQRIKEEHPAVAIAMLTVSEDESDLFTAIRAGARGYLIKSVGIEQLETALQTLASGGAIINPRLARQLLNEFSKIAPPPSYGPQETEVLSPRELEVLKWVGKGYTNKEIAERLLIAENTAKVHVRNIFDKLHIQNRQQAAALAAQTGLVQDVREEEDEAVDSFSRRI